MTPSFETALPSPRVIGRTRSPCNSAVWPLRAAVSTFPGSHPSPHGRLGVFGPLSAVSGPNRGRLGGAAESGRQNWPQPAVLAPPRDPHQPTGVYAGAGGVEVSPAAAETLLEGGHLARSQSLAAPHSRAFESAGVARYNDGTLSSRGRALPLAHGARSRLLSQSGHIARYRTQWAAGA